MYSWVGVWKKNLLLIDNILMMMVRGGGAVLLPGNTGWVRTWISFDLSDLLDRTAAAAETPALLTVKARLAGRGREKTSLDCLRLILVHHCYTNSSPACMPGFIFVWTCHTLSTPLVKAWISLSQMSTEKKAWIHVHCWTYVWRC